MVVSVGWFQSLYRKWLFHQTSVKTCLFRVPGCSCSSSYYFFTTLHNSAFEHPSKVTPSWLNFRSVNPQDGGPNVPIDINSEAYIYIILHITLYNPIKCPTYKLNGFPTSRNNWVYSTPNVRVPMVFSWCSLGILRDEKKKHNPRNIEIPWPFGSLFLTSEITR